MSREISFEATIGGDNECFCWRNIPEEFKQQKRKEIEEYEDEEYLSESHKEICLQMKEAKIDSLYPGDIWRHFDLESDKLYKFTIRVEECS